MASNRRIVVVATGEDGAPPAAAPVPAARATSRLGRLGAYATGAAVATGAITTTSSLPPSAATTGTASLSDALPHPGPVAGVSAVATRPRRDVSRLLTVRSELSSSAELQGMLARLLPPEQVTALLALRQPDGRPFFTLQNREVLYEAVSLIEEQGFDAAQSALRDTTPADFLKHSPLYQEIDEELRMEDAYLTSRGSERVTEGIHQCGRAGCGCRRVRVTEMQTRSADEGMTSFMRCMACGNRWREG